MAKAKKSKVKKPPVAPWDKDLPKLMAEFEKVRKSLDNLSDKFNAVRGAHDYELEDTKQALAMKTIMALVQQASYAVNNVDEVLRETGLADAALEPLPVPADEDAEDDDN
ncbi:MAG: hypothetical protein A2Y38_10280 [Spirochaetes bacterium GWB1_59_5]|nr:MAG: hypothetical protein A2Y38_10280 [Spirochaetes bacterium GWB1_59_5]